MLKKCIYNSRYVAHYAQVKPTMLTNQIWDIMRLSYNIVECGHICFIILLFSGSKVGTSWLINTLSVHNNVVQALWQMSTYTAWTMSDSVSKSSRTCALHVHKPVHKFATIPSMQACKPLANYQARPQHGIQTCFPFAHELVHVHFNMRMRLSTSYIWHDMYTCRSGQTRTRKFTQLQLATKYSCQSLRQACYLWFRSHTY